MSRNLSKTYCPVCKRGFAPTSFSIGEAHKLMTEGQYLKAIGWEDCPYKGNFGYGWTGKGGNIKTHFLRIQCPDCGRLFAGWYQCMGDSWVLFDSSYFFSFDDEPCERDEIDVRKGPAEHDLKLPWHVDASRASGVCMIIANDNGVVADRVTRQDAEAIVETMNRSAE